MYFGFDGVASVNGPNYIGEEASSISHEEQIAILHPERRIYLATNTPSTEMAIDAGFLRDLFITLGERKEGDAWSMTLYVKPFVRWIWLGAILMTFGGILAAADKRYRRLRRKQTESNRSQGKSNALGGELQASS